MTRDKGRSCLRDSSEGAAPVGYTSSIACFQMRAAEFCSAGRKFETPTLDTVHGFFYKNVVIGK